MVNFIITLLDGCIYKIHIICNNDDVKYKELLMAKAKDIAKKLLEKLKKYDDFEGLYLYGSQVTGKANKDSDIDIVGIFKNNRDNSKDVLRDAYKIELDNDIILDFHPMTLEQLQIDWHYFNEIKKGIYYAK